MGVASPELMDRVFSERFNARDTKALLELYTADAVFTFDGEAKAIGREQIEGALAGFLSAPLKFNGKIISLHVSGDTALTRMKWELHNEGDNTTSSGVSAEVLRRCADGQWRFQIDDATGGSRA
ncbi:MAG TPA: SgcJ/EcaC family oxidoreductase [Hyphomonadaceae bacterium]|nr:SgcJ/EcaC family oxidoreductase [Hyphomonadaceae bacterium]